MPIALTTAQDQAGEQGDRDIRAATDHHIPGPCHMDRSKPERREAVDDDRQRAETGRDADQQTFLRGVLGESTEAECRELRSDEERTDFGESLEDRPAAADKGIGNRERDDAPHQRERARGPEILPVGTCAVEETLVEVCNRSRGERIERS